MPLPVRRSPVISITQSPRRGAAPVWAACLVALMLAASPAASQGTPPDAEGQLTLRPGAPLADASGLGPLRRMSDPGRALLAEIPVLDILPVDSDRPPLDVSVKLIDLVEAGPSSPAVPPEIRGMVRSRADGSRYVLIGSRRVLSQPVLTLMVELRWPGGNYRRQYRIDTTTELASAGDLMPAQAPVPVNKTAPAAPLPAITIAAAPAAAAPAAAEVAVQAAAVAAPTMESVSPPPSAPATPLAQPPEPAAIAQTVPRVLENAADNIGDKAADKPAVVAPARAARRQPGVTPAPAPATVASRPATDSLPRVAPDGQDGHYQVRAGDTLAAIGRRFEGNGVTARQAMAAIYQGNAGAFRGDPNRLRAGADLTIPEVSAMREASPLVLARAQSAPHQPEGDHLSLAASDPSASDRRQQVGEESAIALANAMREADSRINELQGQVEKLNQLIALQSSRIEQLSATASPRLIKVDQREQRRSLRTRQEAEPEFHVDITVVVGVLLAAAALMYLVVRWLIRWRNRPLPAG